MARIKVRRTNREELPGIVLLRDSMAPGSGVGPAAPALDLDMELDPTLNHLMTHDPDGFLSALHRDETVGFAAAHVRSKQWILSELWVLPQHRGRGAGEALLTRLLAYGERSGARDYLACVPADGSITALLLRHDFRPLTPLYELRIGRPEAERLAGALARLLPGRDVTQDLLEQRGQADLGRIDRLTRRISREADHVFWLKEAGLNASFVRHHDRIAAYAYGGRGQVGPVAGTSQEAALAALGRAMLAALEQTGKKHLQVLVPAPFEQAVEALLEAGARLQRVSNVLGRGHLPGLQAYIPGSVNLP